MECDDSALSITSCTDFGYHIITFNIVVLFYTTVRALV